VFYRRPRERVTPSRTELYAMWADADAWACIYCGAPWTQVDHFVPLARGGEDTLGNCWPSCTACNQSKSDRDPMEWLRGHLPNLGGDVGHIRGASA
jgi:5-methylcytosine-specific restriction endonuclease McrA